MSKSKYMNYHDLWAMTGRVSYPDATFSLYEDEYLGAHLRIVITMDDNMKPGEKIDVGLDVRVPPIVDAIHFYDFVLWRMQEVEIHEAREKFKVGGVIWSNPHVEG